MTAPASERESSFVKVLAGIAVASVIAVAGAAFIVKEGPDVSDDDVTSLVRRAHIRIGERVTVTGRVGELVSAKSFTLTDEGARLLVLGVATMPAIDNDFDGVFANERVQVSGVVRRFAIEEIESYVGELIEERFEPFLDEPVVVADTFIPR